MGGNRSRSSLELIGNTTDRSFSPPPSLLQQQQQLPQQQQQHPHQSMLQMLNGSNGLLPLATGTMNFAPPFQQQLQLPQQTQQHSNPLPLKVPLTLQQQQLQQQPFFGPISAASTPSLSTENLFSNQSGNFDICGLGLHENVDLVPTSSSQMQHPVGVSATASTDGHFLEFQSAENQQQTFPSLMTDMRSRMDSYPAIPSATPSSPTTFSSSGSSLWGPLPSVDVHPALIDYFITYSNFMFPFFHRKDFLRNLVPVNRHSPLMLLSVYALASHVAYVYGDLPQLKLTPEAIEGLYYRAIRLLP